MSNKRQQKFQANKIEGATVLWLHLQYTPLRKSRPTLLAQVVLCMDISEKHEQGSNVEAMRLCVTSGQSG